MYLMGYNPYKIMSIWDLVLSSLEFYPQGFVSTEDVFYSDKILSLCKSVSYGMVWYTYGILSLQITIFMAPHM